jgi:hypothetical protein
MKIVDFLKSLLPNFSKQTVLEDIRINKLLLTTIVVPAYEDALKVFGARKFINQSLQKDWEVFRRNVRGANGTNTIVAIEKSIKPMLSTLALIESLVEKDYTDDIEGVGITYYKTAILQMLESIGFAIDYSMKYLNYAYVVEAAELEGEDADVANELGAALVPADVRFINERLIDFCTVMDTLSKPTDKIKSDFEEIPDITVTKTGDAVVQHTVGAAKLDPFRHGFVPIAMNPIYHVRMKIADYQHYRYEQKKAEKDALELRKLKLERMQHGKQDPALDKQIEYTQKRIEDLAAQIRKVEEQYA